MKNKNIFLIILFSLSFLPIWGLLLLDIDTSNSLSIFIGILYSILSVYYVKNTEIVKSTKYGIGYIFLFPLFYFGASMFMLPKNYNLLFNPILWAFVTSLLSAYFLKSVQLREMFFIVFISYFYAYHLNPTFKNQNQNNELPIGSIEDKNLYLSKGLQTYFFENNKSDTFNISDNNKFIIIETWNERCPPCIAAMSDLQPLFDSLSPTLDHYYLYENGADNLGMDKAKIYSFPNILNKSKIILDIDNKFFVDSKMESFPYFLLYDSKGNLIDYFKGYDRQHKEYFVNRIKGMVNPQGILNSVK